MILMPEFEQALARFQRLQRDWDGQGGEAVDAQTADAAQRIVTALGRTPRLVTPIPGGGVYLEWSNRDRSRELQIDVLGANRYGYLFVDGDDLADWREGDELSFDEMVRTAQRHLKALEAR